MENSVYPASQKGADLPLQLDKTTTRTSPSLSGFYKDRGSGEPNLLATNSQSLSGFYKDRGWGEPNLLATSSQSLSGFYKDRVWK